MAELPHSWADRQCRPLALQIKAFKKENPSALLVCWYVRVACPDSLVLGAAVTLSSCLGVQAIAGSAWILLELILIGALLLYSMVKLCAPLPPHAKQADHPHGWHGQ
jgi:hypothetical protein